MGGTWCACMCCFIATGCSGAGHIQADFIPIDALDFLLVNSDGDLFDLELALEVRGPGEGGGAKVGRWGGGGQGLGEGLGAQGLACS